MKHVALPLIIIGVVYASGGQSNLKQSLNRVVDYKTTYTPPAPFQFVVTNSALETIENQPFVLDIKVEEISTNITMKNQWNHYNLICNALDSLVAFSSTLL